MLPFVICGGLADARTRSFAWVAELEFEIHNQSENIYLARMEKEDKRAPSWDGDPTKYEEFKERVRWYTSGLSEKDIATAGPRIAANLSGDAWKALEEITEDGQALLRRPGGEKILLKFLLKCEPRGIEKEEGSSGEDSGGVFIKNTDFYPINKPFLLQHLTSMEGNSDHQCFSKYETLHVGDDIMD